MVKASEQPGRIDDEAGGDSPDLAEFRRLAARVALHLHPDATGCSFVVRFGRGDESRSVLRIPITGGGASIQDRIVEFIAKFPPDEYVKGRTIAAEFDLESGSGYFGRLMAELVKAERIESSRSMGYRLKRK